MPPSESGGLEAHFTGSCDRALWDGVGHFPQREAPDLNTTDLR
jgi:hypothetical protein